MEIFHLEILFEHLEIKNIFELSLVSNVFEEIILSFLSEDDRRIVSRLGKLDVKEIYLSPIYRYLEHIAPKRAKIIKVPYELFHFYHMRCYDLVNYKIHKELLSFLKERNVNDGDLIQTYRSNREELCFTFCEKQEVLLYHSDLTKIHLSPLRNLPLRFLENIFSETIIVLSFFIDQIENNLSFINKLTHVEANSYFIYHEVVFFVKITLLQRRIMTLLGWKKRIPETKKMKIVKTRVKNIISSGRKINFSGENIFSPFTIEIEE